MDLLATLQKVMEIEDKNTDEYWALIGKLPEAYRDSKRPNVHIHGSIG